MTGTNTGALPEVSRTDAITQAGHGDLPVPALLAASGAVLLRDAGVTGAAGLAELTAELGLAPMAQVEPFAPRRPLGAGVWSGTAWVRTAPMCMHNELGWQRTPPPFLLIACLRPAGSGGRTGLADGPEMLSRLPGPLVERARTHGWTLVRRYLGGLASMAWEDAFAGMDRAAVEAYARAEEIELEWCGDRLFTRRTRPAVRATGDDAIAAWSNLLPFCSAWTLDPAVRDYLVATLGRDMLPFETCFGDGSPFTAQDVETVNAAFDAITVHVTWRPGDVVLIDNVRVSHSMEPFAGEREMAVVHAAPA